jgi:hypothetical protein
MVKTDFGRLPTRPLCIETPLEGALTNENKEEQQAPASEDDEQQRKRDERHRPPVPRLLLSTPTTGPPQAPRPRPSGPTAEEPLREYLTRREAARYVNDELGRPMSFSTASKLAALGEFAPAALWWGRRPLYTRDSLRTWAEARSRPAKECVKERQSNT